MLNKELFNQFIQVSVRHAMENKYHICSFKAKNTKSNKKLTKEKQKAKLLSHKALNC